MSIAYESFVIQMTDNLYDVFAKLGDRKSWAIKVGIAVVWNCSNHSEPLTHEDGYVKSVVCLFLSYL